MTYSIITYAPDMSDRVTDFNNRMRVAGSSKVGLPHRALPKWLPHNKPLTQHREMYLIVDEQRTVRGGYILRYHDVVIGGSIYPVAAVQGPYSEGQIDRRYCGASVRMIRDMHQRQPNLYGWGMGGYSRTLPQILPFFGWWIKEVPWTFCMPLSRPLPKDIKEALNISGCSPMFFRARSECNVSLVKIAAFGSWLEELAPRICDQYSLITRRNVDDLNVQYGASRPWFLKYRIMHLNQPVGYAVVLVRECAVIPGGDRHTIGVIWDIFVESEFKSAALNKVLELLQGLEADFATTNVSSHQWHSVFFELGFVRCQPRGTNMLIGLSKNLHALAAEHGAPDVCFTHQDGDAHNTSLGEKLGISD